jgi:hypothetical protein
MEQLEERRTFAAACRRHYSVSLAGATNPPVVPLRHDTRLHLRPPPPGCEKWLAVNYFVWPAPRGLHR